MRLTEKLTLSLLFVLALATPSGAESTPVKVKVKVKVTEAIHGVFFLPMYLAQSQGFLARQGLEVKIVSTQAGLLAMQALVSGEVQFCATGHGLVANMYRKGQSTKIVNVMQDRSPFTCWGVLRSIAWLS